MAAAEGSDTGTLAPADGAEFRRGWPVVLACFWVAVFAWGFGFYGQAVYLAELQRIHGWSASWIGAAMTFFYLAGAAFVLSIHQVVATIGPRVLLIGGSLLMGAGAIGFGNADAPWQLFAAGLVMAAGWSATSGTAISTTLALWFDRRRGLAISLALNGASASGFTVAPLLVQLSHVDGLPRAVAETVVAGWVLLVPLILWCVPSHRHGAANPERGGAAGAATEQDYETRAQAVRDPRFWSVALPFALATAAQVGFIVHMVAFLLPLLGVGGTSLAVTGSSVAAMLGRLSLGAVIDRLPRRAMSAACIASQACGLALLLWLAQSPVAVSLGIALFGLSVGNVITLPAVIVQAEFRVSSFGLVIALSGAIIQFTVALSPGVFGLLHDLTGSYDAVLLSCIALQVLAAALVLSPVRRR